MVLRFNSKMLSKLCQLHNYSPIEEKITLHLQWREIHQCRKTLDRMPEARKTMKSTWCLWVSKHNNQNKSKTKERSEDDWTKRTDRGTSVLTALSVKKLLTILFDSISISTCCQSKNKETNYYLTCIFQVS